MTQPAALKSIKVGVLLAPQPDDLAEWLADGASFEVAGVDALWVTVADGSDLDPLVVTAALAAVTVRSLLVTALPAWIAPSEGLTRTLATIGRLSRGRLRILADSVPEGLAGTGPGPGLVRRVPGEPGEPTAFEHLGAPDGPERWISVPSPDGRAGWRAAHLDAAGRGFHGLLVPAGPRLLDILRNPEDPDYRRDLQLAQG